MKTLLLMVEKKSIKKSQKVEKNHFWYNLETKTLEKYNCGKLSFVFDIEDGFLKPKKEDIYINVYEDFDNKNNIEKWMNNYNDYFEKNNDYSSNAVFAINVKNEDIDFVTSSLDFYNIRYEDAN